jgi:urease accessory protein UreH
MAILAGAGLFAAYGLAGNADLQEAEQADALYTEMVCLGRATGNEFGWPNYKNLDITCGE